MPPADYKDSPTKSEAGQLCARRLRDPTQVSFRAQGKLAFFNHLGRNNFGNRRASEIRDVFRLHEEIHRITAPVRPSEHIRISEQRRPRSAQSAARIADISWLP